MASFKYLWTNRTKPQWGSVSFFRVWAKRTLLITEVIRRNRRRAALVSRGAAISETAEIGEVKIEGVKSKLTIGDFSFLGRVYMALHGHVSIGKNVCINDGVEILTASHDIEDPEWRHIVKDVSVGDYAWVGTGAMILPGVSIGKGAVVGARAVVTRSVPDGAVVAGNPAKILTKTRAAELTYNPCEFLAANQAWLVSK